MHQLLLEKNGRNSEWSILYSMVAVVVVMVKCNVMTKLYSTQRTTIWKWTKKSVAWNQTFLDSSKMKRI